MEYVQLARDILENVGGKNNIIRLTHCATRLRFKLVDENIANTDILIRMDGVLTVLHGGEEYQVVIGNNVVEVFDAIMELQGSYDEEDTDSDEYKESNSLDKEEYYDKEDEEEDIFEKELKKRNVKTIGRIDIEEVGFMPKVEKLFQALFKKH